MEIYRISRQRKEFRALIIKHYHVLKISSQYMIIYPKIGLIKKKIKYVPNPMRLKNKVNDTKE